MPIRDLDVLRIYKESETTGSFFSRQVTTHLIGHLYRKPDSTSPTSDLASALRKWHRASGATLLSNRLAYTEHLKRRFCRFPFDQAAEQQIKNDLKTLGFEGFRFLLADPAQTGAMNTLFVAGRDREVGSPAAAKLQAQRTIIDGLREHIAPRCLTSGGVPAVPADARLAPPAADASTSEAFHNYLLFLSVESFLDSLRIGLISADKLFREVSGMGTVVAAGAALAVGRGVIADEFKKLDALDAGAIDRILYLLLYKIKNSDLFALVVRSLIQTFYVLLFDEDFKFSAGFNNEGFVAGAIKSGIRVGSFTYPSVFQALVGILNGLGANVNYEYPTEENLREGAAQNRVVNRICTLRDVIEQHTADLTVTHVTDFIIKTFLQIFVSAYLQGPNLLRRPEEVQKFFCYRAQVQVFFIAIEQADDLSSIMPRVTPSSLSAPNFAELARHLVVNEGELVWGAGALAPAAGQRLPYADRAFLLFVPAERFRLHPNNKALCNDIYALYRAPHHWAQKIEFAENFRDNQVLLIVHMIAGLKSQAEPRSALIKALDDNFSKSDVSTASLDTDSTFITSLQPYLNFSIFYSAETPAKINFQEIEKLYQKFKRLFVSVYSIINDPTFHGSVHSEELSDGENRAIRSIALIFDPSNVREFRQALEKIESPTTFDALIRGSSESPLPNVSGFGAAALGAAPPGTPDWRVRAVAGARAVASPASPAASTPHTSVPPQPPAVASAAIPPAVPATSAPPQANEHFKRISITMIRNLYAAACDVTPPLSERDKFIHVIRALSQMEETSPDKIKEMSRYYIRAQNLDRRKTYEVIQYVNNLVDQYFAPPPAVQAPQTPQPQSPVVQAQPLPAQIPINLPDFPSTIRPVWLSDSQVKRCCNALCRHREAVNRQNPVPGNPRPTRPKEFSTFRRRHHCRGCGAIFCGDCTVEMWVNPIERDRNGTERPLFLFSKDMQQTSFTKTLRNPMGVGGRVKVDNGRTTTLCLQCARNIRSFECTNQTEVAKKLKHQRDTYSTEGSYTEFEKKTDEHKRRNPNEDRDRLVPFSYELSPD